jgi:S-adenosyl-L-methionine hydrolase (adenosine-forming)
MESEKKIISLISDYGSTDYYLSELKAEILSRVPSADFLDISHHIEIHDISAAAFFLRTVYPKCPNKTLHLVAVNNHYRRSPRYIVFEHQEMFFLGPDNGIFSLVFHDMDNFMVYEVDSDKYQIEGINQTYAHVAAALLNHVPIAELGNLISDFTKRLELHPVITSNNIRATIIHIDRYDNAITNLSIEKFKKVQQGRLFSLFYKQKEPISRISNGYGEVGVGEVLARFNSSGYLEIAINMGKAASLLNLHKNETIQIDFH